MLSGFKIWQSDHYRDCSQEDFNFLKNEVHLDLGELYIGSPWDIDSRGRPNLYWTKVDFEEKYVKPFEEYKLRAGTPHWHLEPQYVDVRQQDISEWHKVFKAQLKIITEACNDPEPGKRLAIYDNSHIQKNCTRDAPPFDVTLFHITIGDAKTYLTEHKFIAVEEATSEPPQKTIVQIECTPEKQGASVTPVGVANSEQAAPNQTTLNPTLPGCAGNEGNKGNKAPIKQNRGRPPDDVDKHAALINSLIEAFEATAGTKFIPEKLPSTVADFKKACKAIENAKRVSPIVGGASLNRIKIWARAAGYRWGSGTPPKKEERFWCKLHLETIPKIDAEIFS